MCENSNLLHVVDHKSQGIISTHRLDIEMATDMKPNTDPERKVALCITG